MFTVISTVNLMKPRKPTKHGTKPESPIFSVVSPGVLMPELMPEPLLAAKKFGSRLRHRITASRKPSLRNFSQSIASA
jgi:hypothetical protein